ncbi:Protein 21.1 [Giardia duodenalis assemblage B]|uniref:Protein 21.1 n=1 Tax=Giardia duodenalis assemblage B TaxID=1394984 RepID=A0A132NTN7_GIAIN|nr:Protein 21.1 [Giardia intestinalis assemblage B]
MKISPFLYGSAGSFAAMGALSLSFLKGAWQAMQANTDLSNQLQCQASLLELLDRFTKSKDMLPRASAKDLIERLLRAALQVESQGRVLTYEPQHIMFESSLDINFCEIDTEHTIDSNTHNRNVTRWHALGDLIVALMHIVGDADLKALLQGVVSTLVTSGIEEALVHLNQKYKLQELARRYKYTGDTATNSSSTLSREKLCLEQALLVESDLRLQLDMARFHFDRQQIDFYRTLCNTHTGEERLQVLFRTLMELRDSDRLFVLLTYSYEHSIHLHCSDFSLDTPPPQAKTPLLRAVENDSKECLVDHLSYARCACRDIICLTLNLKTSYFTKYITALMVAAWTGSIQAAKHLLAELGMQTEDGRTALMLAAWKGNCEVMKLLLPEAGMVDRRGKTALMYAASGGHLPCVKMLVGMEAGKQRWWDGSTALIYAAKHNWPNLIDTLATAEARLQTGDGVTALMIAAKNNYLGVINKLSKLEACMQDDYGKTALMEAAIQGHVDACKLLLPFEKQMQNTIDETSLILAVQHNHLDCVKLLIDVESGFQDIDGHSALMWAAKYGNSKLIELLKPKELALKDAFGRTALYYAEHPYWRVSKYNKETCITLLKC